MTLYFRALKVLAVGVWANCPSDHQGKLSDRGVCCIAVAGTRGQMTGAGDQ
jgi:hypothetical protein